MASSTGRTVPYNIDAEESVLASLMLDSDAITQVLAFLKKDDFYREKHQWVYEALIELHTRNEPADLVTVADQLERQNRLGDVGGPVALSALQLRLPTAIHVEHYARIVERTAILRRLIGAAERIAKMAYDESEKEVGEIIEHAERELFAVSQHRLTGALVSLKDILGDFYKTVEQLYMHRQTVGLQTGFTDLDRLLGGFQAGDLVILAARPSMGKTSLALSLVESTSLKYGARVAFFSLEMGVEQLAQRLVSSQTGIDMKRLRVGPIYEEDLERVGFAVETLSKTQIFIDETPAITPLELRTKARRVVSEYGLDLIVIDYLQLMSSGRGKENRVQEVAYISRTLKELARELKLPVIALSQLSRGVESRQDKRPMLSDLRDSGCLTGESLVYLPDSGIYRRIDELVGQRGFNVLALNTESWQFEPRPVTNAFSTGRKPVYKLTTQLGRSIRATANHKFLTIEGWRRLDEVTEGMRIALPRELPSPTHPTMSHEELALLGHLIGDGCTLPRHAIQYTTREPDIAEFVVSLAKKVFGTEVEPRIEGEKSWYQVYLTSTRRHTHGVRSAVSEWLDELGVWGLRSYQKYVPQKVFTQPLSGIAHFLRHLWVTDGCIHLSHGEKHYPSVYYATSSKRLGQDVQALLLRVGINARIRRTPQGNKGRDQYHTIVSGKDDLLRFADIVGTVGHARSETLNQIRLLLEERKSNTNRDVIPNSIWQAHVKPSMKTLGMTHRKLFAELDIAYSGMALFKQNVGRERADKVASIVQSDELLALAQSDVYWDKIASIEPDGEAEVYDLTVEGLHNFVSNNIFVHNSIEQDADVVMFIYRDVVYNKDTERPNIAEVIVSKHRNGPTGTVELRFSKENAKFSDLETGFYDDDEEDYGPPPVALEAELNDIIF